MNTLAQRLNCLHCGEKTSPGSLFCCPGCETVYALLENKNLLGFYQNQKGERVDDVHLQSPKVTSASFYIEGIHCLGCLWILEKLPKMSNAVRSSSLNFGTHILKLEVIDLAAWPPTLRLIHQLGYAAKLIEFNHKPELKDRIVQLQRIGVAAFCTGNIMVLSASIYAGADTIWLSLFPWLSFLLFLPILLFSAKPIYHTAFASLFHGKISVDLPICLAIFAGFLLSVWNLINENPENYFDSLSMLVFLLISSRFLLQQVRLKLTKDAHFLDFSAEEIYKIMPIREVVPASNLKIGDWIEIEESKTIPVDSILRSDQAYISSALLTGESQPVKVCFGDLIEAGSIPNQKIQLEVNSTHEKSRLTKILEQIQYYRIGKSPYLAYADKLGKIFLFSVLLLSALLMIHFWSNPAEGMKRALALMIVTCPCVLAFAVPLSFTRAVQIAGKKGILLKNPEKIESLAEIENLFLDKTGTVTKGQFEVLQWENKEPGNQLYAIAYGLEMQSRHPVAKAIQRHVKNMGIAPANMNAVNQKSDGIEGFYEGTHWSMHRLSNSPKYGENWVGLFRNHQLLSTIHLGDEIREDSKSIVSTLKELGYSLTLLSGDRKENVRALAELFDLAFHAEISPEEKAAIVKSNYPAAMIGDGTNDAIAFQSAEVGIAVQGAVDLSVKNADIVFTKPGLGSLLELLSLCQNTMSLVRHNFYFTLTYNLIAGSFAIFGSMTPLLAAILMPTSALTVFIHTYLRTEKWK